MTHGRVLAELSFGFWRYLLSSRYEATLWTPVLRHAFPLLQPSTRERLYRPLDRLHRLRNRIAHHEPVHHMDLSALEDDAVFTVECIDRDLGEWLRASSRVTQVLRERPRPRAAGVSGRRTGVGGGGGRASAGSSPAPGR